MDPDWLLDHGSVIGLVSSSNDLLHFRNPVLYTRLIRVPLFQKDELCTEDITVKIKLFFQDPPTTDSDPAIMLCDKDSCNGNWIADRYNQISGLTCQFGGFTPGYVGTVFEASSTCGGLAITSPYISPKAVTVTYKPARQWGSFHLPTNGGFTAASTFTSKLDVTQGLFVELYGNNANEEYKLEYMEVEVTRD